MKNYIETNKKNVLGAGILSMPASTKQKRNQKESVLISKVGKISSTNRKVTGEKRMAKTKVFENKMIDEAIKEIKRQKLMANLRKRGISFSPKWSYRRLKCLSYCYKLKHNK